MYTIKYGVRIECLIIIYSYKTGPNKFYIVGYMLK